MHQSGFGATLLPPIGTRLIDSVPPATMVDAKPHIMRSAANAIAWRPDEQKRFTVTAEAATGMPARRLAMRATFSPVRPRASRIRESRRRCRRVESGRAPQRFGNRCGREIVGPRAAERAVRRLANSGANGRNYNCIFHMHSLRFKLDTS